MSNLRKQLSRRLTGSLQPDENHEANIDTVTALALADTLGARLLRLKWDNDSTVYEQCLNDLIDRARASRQACMLSLHEYLEDACRVCQGRVWMQIGDRKIECTACSDHPGIKRYSDRERAAYLRISLSSVKRMSKALQRVRDVIGTAEKAANTQVIDRLD